MRGSGLDWEWLHAEAMRVLALRSRNVVIDECLTMIRANEEDLQQNDILDLYAIPLAADLRPVPGLPRPGILEPWLRGRGWEDERIAEIVYGRPFRDAVPSVDDALLRLLPDEISAPVCGVLSHAAAVTLHDALREELQRFLDGHVEFPPEWHGDRSVAHGAVASALSCAVGLLGQTREGQALRLAWDT